MPIDKIIQVGTAGVDMLSDPITINGKAHFTKNLEHVESRIRTRSSICYYDLGVEGLFQGCSFHSPRFGLLTDNDSISPCAIVTIVNGNVNLNPIYNGIGKPHTLQGINYKGSTYSYSSEQYLIVLNQGGFTQWHNRGLTLTASQGTNLVSDGESHDSLNTEDHKHFLPNKSNIGIYIHGRNVLSVDLGINSTMLLSSDLVNKRKHEDNNELLLMEEEASFGNGITTSAKLGKTVALAKLNIGDLNGSGKLLDFREAGVAEHDLFGIRETKRIVNAEGVTITSQGWNDKRITNEKLNTVSATGRYAVCELPKDVLFGSKFGLHLYGRTLGQGTFNDEPTDNISQDVQPLWETDNDQGRAVGYWIKGNRFLATVNLKLNELSTESNGNAFIVGNKSTTYTEDRTPRFIWEGIWQTHNDIGGIHRFINADEKLSDFRYGFICSDKHRNILYGDFTNTRLGYDIVIDEIGDTHEPIESTYISGYKIGSGLNYTDKITRGYIEYIGDKTTGDIDLYVRSDQNKEWTKWQTIKSNFDDTMFSRVEIIAPSNKSEKGTYFQFKMQAKGNIEIVDWSYDFTQIAENLTGQSRSTQLNLKEENYYD